MKDRLAVAGQELERIRAELPAELDRELDKVSFIFEAVPTEADLTSGVEADQLGLFDGNPLGEAEFPMPTRIVVWLENVWDLAEEDPAIFREEIRITLLHEIGHFLGWDEDDIESRGLE